MARALAERVNVNIQPDKLLSMKKIEAIIFDFDYTLADSSEGIFECINYALKSLGLPAATDDEIKKTIGLSLPATFRKLTDGLNRNGAADFMKHFIKRADEVMAELSYIYDYVPDTLATLKAAGFPLGIVSTKFRYRINTILRRESLDGLIDLIVGGEDVKNHKPDPEGLNIALNGLGLEPAKTFYVGDSPTDAQTARAAGAPFIAVLSGVTGRDGFGDYEPIYILNDVGELPGVCK
jgi:phosphoglycolate phosphatase